MIGQIYIEQLQRQRETGNIGNEKGKGNAKGKGNENEKGIIGNEIGQRQREGADNDNAVCVNKGHDPHCQGGDSRSRSYQSVAICRLLLRPGANFSFRSYQSVAIYRFLHPAQVVVGQGGESPPCPGCDPPPSKLQKSRYLLPPPPCPVVNPASEVTKVPLFIVCLLLLRC